MRHYKREALIYIEPYYYVKVNQAIVENYDFITDCFNRFEIPFIYLPKLLRDSHINKVLEYNHPYLKESLQTHPEKLYHVISHSLNLKIDGPTLVYLSDEGDVTHQFDLPSYEVFTSPEKLFLFVEEIKRKICSIIKDDTESIRFRRVSESRTPLFNQSFDIIGVR